MNLKSLLSHQMIFLLLRLNLTRCSSYCDNGMCFYDDKAIGWVEAQQQCRNQYGSILLEIYNKTYAHATEKAIQNLGLLGSYLPFGLKFVNNQFKWLSSGGTAFIDNIGISIDGQFRGKCYSYLIYDGSHLRIEPSCDNKTQYSSFICLKDNSYVYTSTLSTSTVSYTNTSQSVKNVFSTLSGFNNTTEKMTISTGLDDSNKVSIELQQQQDNNMAIGVGVGVALAIITILSITMATIFLLRPRMKARNKNNQEREGSIPIALTNSSGTSLVYADLGFKENNSESDMPNYS